MASYNLRTVLKMMGQNILNWVKSNCVNNLLSTATNLPLAAAQGKVLDEKIGKINQSLSSTQSHFKTAYAENRASNTETDLSTLLSLGYNRSGLYVINVTSGGASFTDALNCQYYSTNTESNGIITKVSSTISFNEAVITYGLWNGKLIVYNKQSYPINIQVMYIG